MNFNNYNWRAIWVIQESRLEVISWSAVDVGIASPLCCYLGLIPYPYDIDMKYTGIYHYIGR